jgi:hypothetical protein
MPKITEMYAFICDDKGPDDEGLVGTSFGSWLIPLVGADMTRVNALKPLALVVAKRTGKKVKLIHFTHREEIEELG